MDFQTHIPTNLVFCTYFAMGVVEHWRMAGEVVVVHVHQEEGTVQVHLEGEGVEGHHAAEGEGDLSKQTTKNKSDMQ